MLNIVTLVGRLQSVVGNNLFLNVPRTDPTLVPVQVPCLISEPLVKNLKQYKDAIEANALVGIRGKLEYDVGHQLVVLVDKMTFLSKTMKGGDEDDSK